MRAAAPDDQWVGVGMQPGMVRRCGYLCPCDNKRYHRKSGRCRLISCLGGAVNSRIIWRTFSSALWRISNASFSSRMADSCLKVVLSRADGQLIRQIILEIPRHAILELTAQEARSQGSKGRAPGAPRNDGRHSASHPGCGGRCGGVMTRGALRPGHRTRGWFVLCTLAPEGSQKMAGSDSTKDHS